MLRNYLVVAWRNLWRHKLYSLINIWGLAVGLAACLLMLLYVKQELGYDRFLTNAERIYRVVDDVEIPAQGYKAATALTPYPMAQALLADSPEVAGAVCLLRPGDASKRVGSGDRWFRETGILYAQPTFFQVFTFPLVQGDPGTALAQPNSLVLTATTARKYFGGEDPIGRTLSVDGEECRVTGVAADVPANSHLHFDILLPFPNDFRWLTGPDTPTNWLNHSFYTYILLRGGAAPEALEAALPALVERHASEQMVLAGVRIHSRLQPLSSIHLHSHLQYELSPNGDIGYVLSFAAVAVLVLLIGGLNFVSLSTARSAHRSHEVGVRKSVGARRAQLVWQFLGESLLLATAAGGLAAGMVELALPILQRLGGPALKEGLDLTMWGALAGLAAVTGLLAGAYPALLLSGFQPATVLKGGPGRGREGHRFRRGLVVTQFAISIFLVTVTMAVARQLDFLRGRRLGFDQEQVLVLPLPGQEIGRSDTIEEGLRQIPGALHAAAVSAVPGQRWSQHLVRSAGSASRDGQLMYMLFTDHGFLETLGVKLAEGRGFSRERVADDHAFLINRAALERFGWQGIEGKELEWLHFGGESQVLKRGPVIGLVEDFNFRSLHHAIEPLVIQIGMSGNFEFLLLRLQRGDIAATVTRVEEAWHRMLPEHPLEFTFLAQDLEGLYRDEQRYGWLLNAFSLLAIVVAGLGSFGLAAFMVERRTREVGVRKALGASVPRVVALLSKELTFLVLLANLLAWPAAYAVLHQWLNGFAYRAELTPLLFLLGSSVGLVVAWVTVSWQTLRAALANPVDALRQE